MPVTGHSATFPRDQSRPVSADIASQAMSDEVGNNESSLVLAGRIRCGCRRAIRQPEPVVIGGPGTQPSGQLVDEKLIRTADAPVLLRHQTDQLPEPLPPPCARSHDRSPDRPALSRSAHRRPPSSWLGPRQTADAAPRPRAAPASLGHIRPRPTERRRHQHTRAPSKRRAPADATPPQERLQPFLLLCDCHPPG
jgi:hypothetical protein